jgi:hypothetical protein
MVRIEADWNTNLGVPPESMTQIFLTARVVLDESTTKTFFARRVILDESTTKVCMARRNKISILGHRSASFQDLLR